MNMFNDEMNRAQIELSWDGTEGAQKGSIKAQNDPKRDKSVILPRLSKQM